MHNTVTPVTIRLATTEDDVALDRLAQLDSLDELPTGPMLVAERDGELVAARSLTTHAEFADPFVPTLATRRLLAMRAEDTRRRSHRRSRRHR